MAEAAPVRSLPRPGFRSVRDFAAAKAAGRKLVMVTAYDAWSSRLLAEAPVDCVLVGDSAMMVMHGQRDTLGATVELMVLHTRAVARGDPHRFIVADMPFLSARRGSRAALDAAAALMRAGAHAVKIEGVRGHAQVIRHLVDSGIPVMGHLGLTPQSMHALGGCRVQGREPGAASQLKEDALTVEAAGAFALVLECIPAPLARAITAAAKVPTIGIGAGRHCDGQVLVLHDLLGFNPTFRPRFARRFVAGAEVVQRGAQRFASAVQRGRFPGPKEAYSS